jgi:hypothetical protein
VAATFERLNTAISRLAEPAVTVVLPATIFAFAMRSSSVNTAVRLGGPLRWLMLLALVGCAVPYGVSQMRILPRHFLATIAALVGVALLSATWSVTPKLSAERAISLLLLMVAVVSLAAGAARSRERIERLLVSILVAADLVGLAGIVLLVVDHSLAIQSASSAMPERMRGFGQNPNTASMLFALALPLAEWLVISARSRVLRSMAGASCVLLLGSIAASGSRGALVAACAGTVIFVALVVRGVRQLVPAEALAIAIFLVAFRVGDVRPPIAAVAAQNPVPIPAIPELGGSKTPHKGGKGASKPGKGAAKGGAKAIPDQVAAALVPTTTAPPRSHFQVGLLQGLTKADLRIPFAPREDEIGYPQLYEYKPILTYGSGRVFAWLGALRQGAEVPVLGYGFGTENKVFVDRFYYFQGDFTENSFVGMFLQLGLIGVLLLLLPFLLVVAMVAGIFRRPHGPERAFLAATAAVVAAGFVVAFFQSYLYSVGNIATLPFWIAAALSITAASNSAPGSGR